MRTAAELITATLNESYERGYELGLDALTVAPAGEVDAAIKHAHGEATSRLFDRGWQPVELHRVVGRRGNVQHQQLLTDAIAAHKKEPVDARWREQADTLRAMVSWRKERANRIEIIDVSLGLLKILRTLPRIEVLIPPPGKTDQKPKVVKNQAMFERIRLLLAKAESTDYPAEAETYTAKAQELATRHSIDTALISARETQDVVPFARRIGVDHPYEGEKAALLAAVAEANRCHAVWSPELGFTTVFGFDADIDAVDLLHTSLLVQANRAMSKSEPPGGKAGRARLKSFRQSFLVAYASRIGERLEQATAQAVESTQDTNLLPVLASRDAQVRETMAKVFPRTVRGRGSRVDSLEGWDSGTAAADAVELPSARTA